MRGINKMKVDFNNLRKQACYSYDRLCTKLNGNITETDNNIVHLCTHDIQKDMDELRMYIGSIASVYIEDDPDFAEIDITLKEFNI